MNQNHTRKSWTRIRHSFAVIWLCLLGLGSTVGWAQTGIFYNVKLLSGNTYQVSLKSNVTLNSSDQQTGTGQVTIVSLTSSLSISNVVSLTGIWGSTPQIVRNPAVPVSGGGQQPSGNDYILFGLAPTGVSIGYQDGVEIPLFKFDVVGSCAGPLSIWESNDPFQPTNSQNINVGNDLTAGGFTDVSGDSRQGWLGNYNLGQAPCGTVPVAPPTLLVSSPTGGTTTTTPTVSGTATPGSFITVLGSPTTGPGSTTLCTTTAVAGTGSFSCVVTVPVGPNQLTITAANPGGTVSAPTGTFTAVSPVSPPPLTVSSPVNTSTSTTPVVSGNTTPNTPVVITGPGGQTLCSTVSNGNGLFSCSLTSPLAATPTTLTVSATNAGGTTSQPISFTPVVTPTVSITSPDGITVNGPNVPISGTATPGSTVVISTPGTPTACQTTATATGVFSCTVSVTGNPITVTATASNPGGTATDVATFTVAAPPSNPACAVEYNISLSPDRKTYVVTMKTNVAYTGADAQVATAQVCVRTLAGTFTPVSVSSVTGDWTANTPIRMPSQNTGYDYFFFGLAPQGTSMPFENGRETVLFTFKNTGNCTGELQLMNADDPLYGSSTVNAGNEITVLGYGPDNAWCQNYGAGQAGCPDPLVVAILSPASNTTTTTTPTVSGTATPNATITLTGPGNTIFCQTVASNTGTWSCTGTLAPGPQSLTAIATDNGMMSPVAVTNFTIVSPAPSCTLVAPMVSPMSATVCPGSSQILTAIGETGATYGWTGAGLNQTTGNMVTATPTGTVPVVYTVTQSLNGCTSEPGFATVVASASVCILPTVAILSPTTNSTAPGPIVVVSGTATSGSSVIISEGGLVLCSTTATSDGSYSCSIPLTDGPHTLMTLAQNQGGTGTSLPVNLTIVTPVSSSCVTLTLKVLLEGPYGSITGLMSTVLNQRGLLPGQTPIGPFALSTVAGQPYNVAPWNYTGAESLTIYPTTVVDWVLVSLRTSAPTDLTVTNALQVAGLLHNDGHISFVNPCFSLPSGNYYVVIEHRNHLGVMSPTAVPVVNNVMSFDFTKQDSYVVTDPPSFGQIQIGTKWLMYAADGSKAASGENYDINFFDSLLWQLESGIFDQYRLGDYNLDADVNSDDNVLWKKNNGRYSRVPQNN